MREAIEQNPDVAVLDIGMPLLNGIEATRQIVRRAPGVRILILSMHSDQACVTQAVQAGARGVLLKESAGSELIAAIAAVAAGKTFSARPSRRSCSTTSEASPNEASPIDTTRYRNASVRCYSSWLKEKAARKSLTCCRSARPLSKHTERICSRLGLRNTAEVVRYAARRGIVHEAQHKAAIRRNTGITRWRTRPHP